MTVKICERHVTYTFFFNRESICGRVYKSCKSLVALYPLFFEEISILKKKKSSDAVNELLTKPIRASVQNFER